MEARVFNKTVERHPTTRDEGAHMEGLLRPRRVGAWTSMHNKFPADASPRSTLTKGILNAKRMDDFKPEDGPKWHAAGCYACGAKDAENLASRRGTRLAGCGEPVRDYLTKSSMHGLRYIGESRLHWAERGFWALAFVSAVLGASYYITILYNKWENEPVIMSLSPTSTSLLTIPFPALTLCNMNRAKLSEVRTICNETDAAVRSANEELLNYLCEQEDSCQSNSTAEGVSEKNTTKKWDTIQKFLIKVSPSCNDMLRSCKFAGSAEKCEDMFNPTLTDEGLCCTFNRVHRGYLLRDPRDLSDLNITFPKPTIDWKPEEGYPARTPTESIPLRPVGAGSHLGLTLVLNTEADEYYCSSTSSIGFKMLLHSPVETPKINGFGIVLSPGQEYNIVIKPSINKAKPSLKAIPTKKRQCVFANERHLRYYRTYTQRNCALECEANFTLAMCKCVLNYMPKNASTRICGKVEEKCGKTAQHMMELHSVDEREEEEGNATTRCECLPGCSEINYRGEVTSSSLLSLVRISERDHLINVSDDDDFKKNMAVVHLFFTETKFTSVEKGELFGFTEFLSNTGGLLGLFLGFSFLSVVEICYHFTIKLWCASTRGRNVVSISQLHLMEKELRNSENISVHYPYAP